MFVDTLIKKRQSTSFGLELDMLESELDQLLTETLRRQRRKTDLSEFDGPLREMMEANISLPVMLDWLKKKGQITTMPALRRYVRRVFGDDYYDGFVKRNGWHRNKENPKPQTRVEGRSDGATEAVTEAGVEEKKIGVNPQQGTASQEQLKKIVKGVIDPNQFLDDS